MRLAWPSAWALNSNPNRRAKAAISGAGIIAAPTPGAHDDAGVVDDAAPAGPAEILQGRREERLAPEPVEGRVVLHVDHAADGQDQAGALGHPLPAADLHPMGRGVRLHFLPGLERVAARGDLGLDADPVAPAVGREGLVAEPARPWPPAPGGPAPAGLSPLHAPAGCPHARASACEGRARAGTSAEPAASTFLTRAGRRSGPGDGAQGRAPLVQ